LLSIRNFSGQLSVVKTTDEDLNVSYTFTDKPATVTHTHAASGKTTRTEVHAYSYDHADRLLKVEHTLGGTNVTLAAYGYDNFGRLQSKSLHGSSTNKLTYAYNVRNWLTGISGSKFTQNLYYNTGNGTARYNGSISSMTWKAGNESTVRGYKFTYDGLDRLLNATYGETAGINANTDRFSENVTAYDKNGNIKTLQRYGQTAASGYGLIDNLTFTLAGNLLNRVDDAAAASAYGGGFEFKDGVKQANEYTYDSNGNLTKDLNKGISTITYNVLNLPNMVTFSDGSTIAYTYGADGTKLKTVHKTGSTTTTTDYCGNVVYENGVQKLLLTDEGYVTLSDSKYHYYLKDHQGNNRVVINQSGTVEETNHYYPFGGVFASSGNVQPYKYNGKELDAKKGLNWYDYGARHYDAALGRFTTVDPSAENYYSTSPFTYCLNNPLNYIDPLGTDTVDVKDVDWNKFDPKKDVVALDEVAVSVPNALTKVGTRALEPISGFWGYVGYYLLDIGSTYHSEQTRFTYKVGTDGVITGVAPMVGTPPLPGFAKTSNLNTIRGLWSLTKQGSSKVMKHPIRGLFYKSKSDGLWWVKDQTKHGGSFYKVYKETNKGLEWHKDADKYGNFIINKHKSDVGIFIPWKELSK
jgi:RHS repeat-associated protein